MQDIDIDTFMTNPYPEGFEKVMLLEGQSGDWRVEKLSLSEDDVQIINLRCQMHGDHLRIIPPGDYTRLTQSGSVVMSDTPAEAHDHRRALASAHGRVLVAGLGLGFFLDALLRKPEVGHVTVVEKNADVVALCGLRYAGNSSVDIIESDIFEFTPPAGARYDFIWHDIWPDICEDNRSQMSALRSKYAKYADAQGCWSEEYLPRR